MDKEWSEKTLKILGTLHQKKNFQKIQEVLGYEIKEGLRILEENR